MKKRWDYVIVGAGTAGCVLAERLSADPDISVLLLEAGGARRNPWLYIPVGYFKTVGNPATDWMYMTEPETGLDGRRIPWPRGKVIGGSGSINGLVYVRGQPEDYDSWAAAGCEGWGWSDLLPYFVRSEDQERGASDTHGTSGYLCVSDDRTDFEISRRFVDAAVAAGLPENGDCNDGMQYGVGYYQTMSSNGLRSSTASGYLSIARRRRNLSVVTNALCETVLFENSRAVGVRYKADGKRRAAYCDREIVLAAGAIGSPQLLLLSGIGDPQQLGKHGIDVRVPLHGVGKNLQDHLKIHNSYRTSIPTLNDMLNSFLGRAGIAMQYLLTRRGPMTMGAAPVFCFAHSRADSERPDVQFHVLPWSSSEPSTGRMHPYSGFTSSLCPLRPESRGSVSLRSADPADSPRIVANYLETEADRRTAIEAVRLSRTICSQSPLADVIVDEIAPGKSAETDADILAFIRCAASTVFHPVGTCLMGNDGDAVVDPSLRVHGVDGLRVADASIMPSITSGNTNAPVVAIAEKAGDLILESGDPR